MSPPGAAGHIGERDDAEGSEDAWMERPASTAFGLAAGNVEGWEDIVCLIAIAG